MDEQVIQKWEFLIEAARKYWVDCTPTGMSDETYDQFEKQAAVEDNFFVRDYVFNAFLKGTKYKNKYIEKIKKFKVNGSSTMLNALTETAEELGLDPKDMYCDLKYDGSSIAIYVNPANGKPMRIVTVGNLNLDNYGVDQTWKLMKFLPPRFPLGITAIQCEALIDTDRLNDIDPERARQKANGLINSKNCEAEVNSLLTLRAYRYYTDDSYAGNCLKKTDYRDVLYSFHIMRARADGHIVFAPAHLWTLEELKSMPPGFCETDKTVTNTGTFLNDGWVVYNKFGVCQRALKFAGAGSGTEAIKTTVQAIQWNNQTSKGKDSWSANVIVDPVTLKGCLVKKPSAGSVAKLIKNNITPGAEVGLILANSTIPMVGDVFKEGNGDYQWPTCSCGYQLGPNDIYGSLIKCGNPLCTERLGRMKSYLSSVQALEEIDLNQLLVIDRFRWENTEFNLQTLLEFVRNSNEQGYHDYLDSFLNTKLQKRNLELVWKASFIALKEKLSV